VRLVDDEHAIARVGGRVEGAVAQLTGVVDTTVTGGVELGDVDAAGALRRERLARGSGVGPFLQLSERAMIRALDVFPQPRGPEKR